VSKVEAAEDFLSKLFAKDEDFSNRVIPHALVVAVALQHRARHLFLDGDDDAAVNNMPSRLNILLL
jgi:hypothetical protein